MNARGRCAGAGAFDSMSHTRRSRPAEGFA